MQLFGWNGGPFYLLPKLPLGKKSTQGSEVGCGLKSTIMNRSGLLPLWADMEKRRSGVLHGLRSPPSRFHYYYFKEIREGVALRRNLMITNGSSGLSQAGAWERAV
ncbi:hypothetical protein IH824_14225 [candidate division KSB1 bacterium]|nr:hypothetical protein [candidate division KSB1 bacterium]